MSVVGTMPPQQGHSKVDERGVAREQLAGLDDERREPESLILPDE